MKLFTTLCTITLLTGCASNTGSGVISGTTLAATIGGLTRAGEGAIIGSSLGLVTGSIFGIVLDEQDRKIMQQTSPRTLDRMNREEPLTINDMIKLSQGGVSDDAIISYIEEKKTVYNLTQAQVRRLRDAGVSQRVIDFMQTKSRD